MGTRIALRGQGRPKKEVTEQYICPLCSCSGVSTRHAIDGIVNSVLELRRWQQVLEVSGMHIGP